jgi:hypothetical protein
VPDVDADLLAVDISAGAIAREHDRIRLGGALGLEVCLERLDDDTWDWNTPAPGARLGRSDQEATVRAAHGLGSVDRPVQQVDAISTEGEHLAETEASPGAEDDERYRCELQPSSTRLRPETAPRITAPSTWRRSADRHAVLSKVAEP